METNIISTRIQERRRAIVKTQDGLAVLDRAIESKEILRARAQEKRSRQLSGLAKLEKLEKHYLSLEQELGGLRGQLSAYVADYDSKFSGTEDGFVPVTKTGRYKDLKNKINTLEGLSAETVTDANRVHFGKDEN